MYGQHGEAVVDELLGRLEQRGRVGQQRALVADHLELDPVGLERLAGELGGEDGVARREAAGRVREQAHAGAVEHVDDRAALRRVDAPQRDGDELGAAASIAAASVSSERKPPVPSSSRERSSVPAMVSGSADRRSSPCSASLDRAQDLDPRALCRARASPTAPRGTTSASTATATPRPAAGRSSESTAACTVAPAASSAVSPFSSTFTPAPPRSGAGRPARPTRAAARRSRGRDQVGGERREQDAVAEVAGRPAAGRRRCPGPMAGRLSGVAGSQAGAQLLDVELEHAGDDLAHVAQQLVDAAGRGRGVVAALLHRGAEHVARRRRAGRGRPAAPRIVRSTRPGPRGSRRRMTWPLTGRTGTRVRAPRPGRRRRRSGPGRRGRPRRRRDGRRRRGRARRRAARTTAARRYVAAGALEGLGQRGDQQPRVDRVVAGHVEREPHGRRERRLGAARLARPQPLDLEAELAPEGERALERLGLVAVARHQQRAALVPGSADASPSSAQNAPKPRAARSPSSTARHRRTAPRRPGRACPRRPARRRGRRRRARSCAARDRPRARRRRGRSPRRRLRRGHTCWRSLLDIPSLRRHYPDQVRRSAAHCRPLSPVVAGSRSGLHMLAAMTPRERLATARLYLVCDARPREWLAAAVRGGVDIVQLRDKTLDDDGLDRPRRASSATSARSSSSTTGPTSWRRAAPTACTSARTTCRRPRRARSSDPTGSSAAPRTRPTRPTPPQADPDVDYLAVGPVWETPTKPGRPAAGLEYVEYAARTVTKPWFAIGGIDAANLSAVVDSRRERDRRGARDRGGGRPRGRGARARGASLRPDDRHAPRLRPRSRERDERRCAPRSSRWSPASGPRAVTVAAVVAAVLGLLLVGRRRRSTADADAGACWSSPP